MEISQTRAISDTLQHIKSLLDSGRCRSKAIADIALHIEHELNTQVSQCEIQHSYSTMLYVLEATHIVTGTIS